jgi:hypothetical protein
MMAIIPVKANQQLTAATGIRHAIVGYLFVNEANGSDVKRKPGKVFTR